ncbi:hypothetical protein FZEAL_6967 [Fusarium zealandicum]|uniref:Amidoligase n=1 Tax=Fusarium zealandicum TaxID=1053134 RepID=A0A8H4UGP9_9HYPO|nr:hypothetical protein FZEAL_6967 [Fusarium zealandicum]
MQHGKKPSQVADLSLPQSPEILEGVQFQAELRFMVAMRLRENAEMERDSSYVRHSGHPIPYLYVDFADSRVGYQEPCTSETNRLLRAQLAAKHVQKKLHDKGLYYNPFSAQHAQNPAYSSNGPNSWTVRVDEDLEETQCKQYNWIGLKIASPATKSEGMSNFRCQLADVLEILDTDLITFASADSRLGIRVTSLEDNFTLEQLKGVASFLWVTNPHLSKLHPTHCGPNSLPSLGLEFTHLARKQTLDIKAELASGVSVEDPWNNRLSPNRRPLELLRYPEELSDARQYRGLKEMNRARTVAQLLDLLDFPVNSSTNTISWRPAYAFHKPEEIDGIAIDFNQHAGTLSSDAIVEWAILCTRVVSFGLRVSASPSPLTALRGLKEITRHGEAPLFDLLTSVESGKTAKDYEQKDATDASPDMNNWPILRKSVPDDKSDAITMSTTSPQPPSLEEFARRACNWAKSSKYTQTSAYSFGVELEVAMPTSLYPIDPAPSSAYEFQRDDDTRPAFPPAWFTPDDPEEYDMGEHATRMDVDEKNDFGDGKFFDPDPSDPRKFAYGALAGRRHNQMAVLLSSLGHPAIAYDGVGSERVPRAWKLKLASLGLFYVDRFPAKYQTWTFMEDGSIEEERHWNGYDQLAGMELVSPILRDSPDSWGQVLDVVSGMRNNVRLTVNSSCGLHIHVSKGSEPLPLQLLRKIACLLVCADKLIFSLVPEKRQSAAYVSPLLDASSQLCRCWEAWCEGLNPPPDFEQHIPVECVSGDFLTILVRLWMVQNMEDLHQLVSPIAWAHKLCVTFFSCREYAPGHCRGSVEFRHLEGTMDPGLILRWGQLMASLFQFADLATPDAWKKLLRTIFQCQATMDYNVEVLQSFLEQLGLGEDYDFWASRVKTFREAHKVTASESSLESTNDPFKGLLIRDTNKNANNGVKILPPISDEEVEALRRHLCQRQRPAPYLPQQEHADELPASLKGCLQKRVETLLESIGLEGPNVVDAIEHIIQDKSKQSDGGHQSPPRPVEESCETDKIYLFNVLQRSRAQARRNLKKRYDHS